MSIWKKTDHGIRELHCITAPTSWWLHISVMMSQITATLTAVVRVNGKENIKALHYWVLVKGSHWGPMDSPHKRPTMWKAFHIMNREFTCTHTPILSVCEVAGSDSLWHQHEPWLGDSHQCWVWPPKNQINLHVRKNSHDKGSMNSLILQALVSYIQRTQTWPSLCLHMTWEQNYQKTRWWLKICMFPCSNRHL